MLGSFRKGSLLFAPSKSELFSAVIIHFIMSCSHLFLDRHDLSVPRTNVQRHVADFVFVLSYCLDELLFLLFDLPVSLDTCLFLSL